MRVSGERFKGKVALLTGAASGIGRSVAVRLATEGASVFGVDIDEARLAETAAAVAATGGTMRGAAVDLRTRGACFDAVERAVAEYGRLDVVGNIAGVNRFRIFTEMTEEDWHAILSVNVTAVAFVCQAAIPHLIETSGNIVNLASVAGLIGQAYTVAYCASKGAVIQLTRALAMEYVKTGIRVNAIAPAGVDTAMNVNIDFPAQMDWKLVKPYVGHRGLASADEIAGLFAFLASDDARPVHGAVWAADFGVSAG
jgi:NAD(P)-dependent dehydrogenase (short-subunit alcohol dehydrogenase family)